MDEFENIQPEWDASESAGGDEPVLESPFGEFEEAELAAELLGVNSERELDRFLGGLLRKAASAAGGFLTSSAGRALGAYLKLTIKKALPALGRGAGDYFAPDLWGQMGSRVASDAGQTLGLELEGLSGEDQEFEVAKSLVRMASAAAGSAATAPQSLPAVAVAKQSVAQAARHHAPGLLRSAAPSRHRGCSCHATGGRWERRNSEIILYGL